VARTAEVTLQAPSLLKLVIEASVFFIGAGLEAMGILALLLIPTWSGLIFFMAKRSREGYCVDITPEGVSVGTPVDRYFLSKDDITGIRTARLFPFVPSICIHAGRRKIVLRKLIAADTVPAQKRLWAWLRGKPPSRAEIRSGMLALKQALEKLLL